MGRVRMKRFLHIFHGAYIPITKSVGRGVVRFIIFCVLCVMNHDVVLCVVQLDFGSIGMIFCFGAGTG